ncbi:hypothetical protein DWUX_1761 [Desulfovibrio diazotrophicus]|nr:hypothetical protein DWUX_1761 [Desulfovibrio diazotrophicus]VVU42920.1 hypothetical protein DWUX_266 [Desulfovibrio diazotrophicus]
MQCRPDKRGGAGLSAARLREPASFLCLFGGIVNTRQQAAPLEHFKC